MDKKIINIGFVGHSFCGGNLGLGALAFGELYALQEACKRLGYDYRITSFETGINHPYSDDSKVSLKTYNLRNIVKTSRLFSSQDILFDIGGGDSFADIYGAKLYVVQMFIKLAVLFSRKPYVLPPQTYGPYSRWWTRCFANYYIKHAKAVFARDMISTACLSDINKKRVEVITDLGFLMSWQLSEKFDRFTVGFNISGLLYQSENLLGKKHCYKQMCHMVIEHFLAKGIKVVLIPHVVGFEDGIDNDYFVCKKLAESYHLDDVIAFSNPKGAKTYISKCHFFIGSRMHATIGAVSAGVPTLPLAYSRKFKGVFNLIHYDYTLDLSTTSVDTIVSAIDLAIDKNYQSMSSAVAKSQVIIQEYSEAYINRLMALLK